MTDPALPARAGDIILFTPRCAAQRDPAPVYQLRVPTLSQRAAYQRDILERGAVYPGFVAANETLRDAIRGAMADDESVAAAIGVVDDFENAMREGQGGVDFAVLYGAFIKLEREIIGRSSAYAAVAASAQHYNTLSQIVILQHLLVGWSKTGYEAKDFVRENGVTSEITLGLIPADEFAELAARAADITHLTQAKSKKSAPPALSSSSPNASQAAPTTATSGPTTGA